jgi:sugar phosphate isomerase/epimerase
LDFEEQVSLLREEGVTHYTFRPRVIPEAKRDEPYHNHGNHKFDLTPQRLVDEGQALRKRLEAAGLVPFGTVPQAGVMNDPEHLEQHFAGAAAAGAGRIRMQPPPPPKEPFDYAALLEQAREAYAEAVKRARPHGLKLVIETHANSLASAPGMARALCAGFDPSDLGVIFDLPNFGKEGNLQPQVAVSTLGPWIDHVHIGGSRRTTGDYDAQGFRRGGSQMCPLTEADLHIPTWLSLLDRAGVHVPLIVEDFTASMPGAERLREAVRAIRRALQPPPEA